MRPKRSEIVDACARHGVMLMEAFMWRHQARVAHARTMLADGQLGELRLVKMDFSFDIDRTRLAARSAPRWRSPYDLGCYGINAARLFTGAEPSEVIARCAAALDGRRYDVVDAAAVSRGTRSRCWIAASNAPIATVSRSSEPRGRSSFPSGVLPPPKAELVYRHGEAAETIRFPANDQYVGQIECFCASVAAGPALGSGRKRTGEHAGARRGTPHR